MTSAKDLEYEVHQKDIVIEKLKINNNELIAQSQAQDPQVDGLLQAKTELEHQLASKDAQLKALEMNLEKQNSAPNCEEHESEIARLGDLVNQKNGQLQQMQTTYDQLRKSHMDLKQEKQSSAPTCEEHEAVIAHLNALIAERDELYRMTPDALKEARAESKAFSEEKDSLVKQLADLKVKQEGELKTVWAMITLREDTIKKLQSQVQGMVTTEDITVQGLQAQLQTLQSQNQSLESQLQAQAQGISVAEDTTIQDLQAQVKSLQFQLQAQAHAEAVEASLAQASLAESTPSRVSPHSNPSKPFSTPMTNGANGTPRKPLSPEQMEDRVQSLKGYNKDQFLKIKELEAENEKLAKDHAAAVMKMKESGAEKFKVAAERDQLAVDLQNLTQDGSTPGPKPGISQKVIHDGSASGTKTAATPTNAKSAKESQSRNRPDLAPTPTNTRSVKAELITEVNTLKAELRSVLDQSNTLKSEYQKVLGRLDTKTQALATATQAYKTQHKNYQKYRGLWEEEQKAVAALKTEIEAKEKRLRSEDEEQEIEDETSFYERERLRERIKVLEEEKTKLEAECKGYAMEKVKDIISKVPGFETGIVGVGAGIGAAGDFIASGGEMEGVVVAGEGAGVGGGKVAHGNGNGNGNAEGNAGVGEGEGDAMDEGGF